MGRAKEVVPSKKKKKNIKLKNTMMSKKQLKPAIASYQDNHSWGPNWLSMYQKTKLLQNQFDIEENQDYDKEDFCLFFFWVGSQARKASPVPLSRRYWRLWMGLFMQTLVTRNGKTVCAVQPEVKMISCSIWSYVTLLCILVAYSFFFF